MRILEITFQAFFDDTQQLVSDGILADIEEVITAADSEDTRNVKFLCEQGDLTWVNIKNNTIKHSNNKRNTLYT